MPSQKELADLTSSDRHITNMPLVDVNLVTYNHEKYVARAIESIIEQKTDFDYRLIIGDDCSTDKTRSIIEDYARQYPQRIQTILASEHCGILHRDRVGIKVLRASTAEYVAMLDGDDYWTNPNKLQKQVDFLRQHQECSLCFHNAEMFYEDGAQPPKNLRPPDQKEISTLEDVINGMVPIPCTVMFRNKLLGDLPDWFYTVTNADWIMWVMLAEHGYIGYINEVMAAYRMHPEGIWSRLTGEQRVKEHTNTYQAINAHLNFKYDSLISEIIAALPKRENEHHARSCLDRYHRLVQHGEFREGLRFLSEATRFAPLEVLRPRRLAAVVKHGLLGVFWRRGAQNQTTSV